MAAPLPDFTGKVIQREVDAKGVPTGDYATAAYQYATTSCDRESMFKDSQRLMQPGTIVFAAGDDDIIKAILYCKANNLGLAVRSGGHQYVGASSTFGDNLQIDLSGRYATKPEEYPYSQMTHDLSTRTITLGVGVPLGKFNLWAGQKNIFVPRGECENVHVGGHSNTGGMSIISPAFGLFIDHVISFRIILEDGKKYNIVKPGTGQQCSNPNNDDLYWAVLGGSPGNFGVLTDLTLTYLQDGDYPKSRVFQLVWPLTNAATLRTLIPDTTDNVIKQFIMWLEAAFYDPVKTLEKVCDLVCELVDNKELSARLSLSVMTVGAEHFPGKRHGEPATYDDLMYRRDPEMAGEIDFSWPIQFFSVGGVYMNPGGADEDDSDVQAFLQRFRDIKGWEQADALNQHFGLRKPTQDGRLPTPISTAMTDLTFYSYREFTLSYWKTSYLCKTRNTQQKLPKLNGQTLSQWWAKNVWEIEGNNGDNKGTGSKYKGVHIACQFGVLGGPAMEAPLHQKPVLTSVSNRDCNVWFDYEVFYNPMIEGAAEKANAYMNPIARAVAFDNVLELFEPGRQRRVILAPFFVDGEKAILDEYHQYFYDSEAKYERLLAIKAKLDPKHVFTPNLFCVGATKCARLQRQIEAINAQTRRDPVPAGAAVKKHRAE